MIMELALNNKQLVGFTVGSKTYPADYDIRKFGCNDYTCVYSLETKHLVYGACLK